jgi:hypothetical protein
MKISPMWFYITLISQKVLINLIFFKIKIFTLGIIKVQADVLKLNSNMSLLNFLI